MENEGSEGRCKAGQRSLQGLKILIDNTKKKKKKKQDPAPSFVRTGTSFHSNQARRQETELGEKKVAKGCLEALN